MRTLFLGAFACALFAHGAAPIPLTFQDIQAKARSTPERWRTEAMLAEHQLQYQGTSLFLRDGATIAAMAGPRRVPGAESTTDNGLEVDLPLFLSPRIRANLAASLDKASPLLLEATRRESLLRLKTAYLDAWLAARIVVLREADLATVDQWLRAAKARLDAGADPAFQVSLVEGERLKVLQEVDEARIQESRCWGVLAALSELPNRPMPLADPGDLPNFHAGDWQQRFAESPLRKAILAQAELETRGLRLKEAQSLSRWSLRGSHAKEGDERVSRIGLAIRLPRAGESTLAHRVTETQLQIVQGETQRALAELEARAESIFTRARGLQTDAALPDFAQALEAVGLRLREGRERPSEALPIRRQLLESQMACLRRAHGRHLLAAELQYLLSEVNP